MRSILPPWTGHNLHSSCLCWCWDRSRRGLVMATGMAWGGGQAAASPCLPVCSAQSATSLVPISLSLCQHYSDAADFSQNCSHILTHVWHAFLPPKGASVLLISPPAPLPPYWQQQGLQSGLAWLDPWSGRGARSSCHLSSGTSGRKCCKKERVLSIKQGLHAGFSVPVSVPSLPEVPEARA